jgi:cell division septal protein FtsQ
MKDGMGASLKFEADFFRKSNNMTVAREKKIRSIQVRTVHLLMVLALVLLCGVVISRLANFLLTCDALQIRSFHLTHPPVFSREKVEGILRRFGGNILALDLEDLQARLLRIPEIAGVSIRRVLPDRVKIDFSLRRPFFQSFQDGDYRLLDCSGHELGRQSRPADGLIPVRGDSRAVDAIAAFSDQLRPLRGKIEYVAFGEPRGIELKLLGVPEIFFPGEGEIVGKINRYFRIKGRLMPGAAAIGSVDLRIPGRIYCEFFETQRGNP